MKWPWTGKYADYGGDGAAVSEPTTTLFQSVQQLGLRLEARKAPMEMIVVDHADNSPTEN